jgi:hypothetical protein
LRSDMQRILSRAAAAVKRGARPRTPRRSGGQLNGGKMPEFQA